MARRGYIMGQKEKLLNADLDPPRKSLKTAEKYEDADKILYT